MSTILHLKATLSIFKTILVQRAKSLPEQTFILISANLACVTLRVAVKITSMFAWSIFKFVFVGLLIVLSTCLAQGSAVDSTFDPGIGSDGLIRVIALDQDQKLLVAGNFTNFQGVARLHLARLNSNGSLDDTFDPGTNIFWQVASLAVCSDGKIMVGGTHTTDNSFVSYIVRLKPDGTLDPAFTRFHGLNHVVLAVAAQPDGKILMGGAFGWRGTNTGWFLRFNSEGTPDTIFNSQVPSIGAVGRIVVQQNGKILVAGGITISNGVYRRNLARLNSNGSTDETFNSGTNTPAFNVLTVQPDGKILLAGSSILRLNSDGTTDPTFDSGTGTTFGNPINAIAVNHQGKIIIAGGFRSYNGVQRNRVAWLDANGVIDPTSFVGEGANNQVQQVVLQNDGKAILGGYFTKLDGIPRNGVGRFLGEPPPFEAPQIVTPPLDQEIFEGENVMLSVVASGYPDLSYQWYFNSNVIAGATKSTLALTNALAGNSSTQTLSSAWAGYYMVTVSNALGVVSSRPARLSVIPGPLDSSFDLRFGIAGPVFSLAIQTDNKIVIAGALTTTNGLKRSGVARLNSDGSYDFNFNFSSQAATQSFNSVDQSFYSVDVQSDGKIIIAGGASVIRLGSDGAVDGTFSGIVSTDGQVGDLTILPDQRILLGGGFKKVNGLPRQAVALLHPNGELDLSFDPRERIAGVLNCVIPQSDGKIIVAGDFKLSLTAHSGIARLNADGSVDTGFNQGAGTDNRVLTAAIQNDGKIIIAGPFTSVNNVKRQKIARLNADGTLDTTFDAGTGPDGFIACLLVQPSGKILIGGSFVFMNGVGRNRIARLNEDGSIDPTFKSPGADDTIFTMASQSDGKIVIGGGFLTVGGVSRQSVARLQAESPKSSARFAFNASGMIEFRFAGTQGESWQIEQSTNLLQESWSLFTDTTTTTNSILIDIPPGNSSPVKFFRAVRK